MPPDIEKIEGRNRAYKPAYNALLIEYNELMEDRNELFDQVEALDADLDRANTLITTLSSDYALLEKEVHSTFDTTPLEREIKRLTGDLERSQQMLLNFSRLAESYSNSHDHRVLVEQPDISAKYRQQNETDLANEGVMTEQESAEDMSYSDYEKEPHTHSTFADHGE